MMHKLLIGVLILSILVFVGLNMVGKKLLSTEEKSLIGTWKKGMFNPRLWGITITFYENHTFDYSYFDERKQEESGTWKLVGNELTVTTKSGRALRQGKSGTEVWIFKDGKLYPNLDVNGKPLITFYLEKEIN